MRNFDKWYYESINWNVINQIIWHIMSFTKLETPFQTEHFTDKFDIWIGLEVALYLEIFSIYISNICLIKKEMRIWLENLIVRLEEDCKCIWNDVFCLSDNRFVMKRSLIDRSETKKICDIIASCEKYFGLYYAIHMEYKFGH